MDQNLKLLAMAASAISLGVLSFWIWFPSQEVSYDFPQTTQTFYNSTSSRSFDDIPAKTSPPKSVQGRNPGEMIFKNAPSGSMDVITTAVRAKDDLGTVSVESQIPSRAATLAPQVVGSGQNPSPSLQVGSYPKGAFYATATDGFSAASIAEIVQDVPEGAKVPALFYDNESKPIPQQKALDLIAVEFQQNVSEIPSGMTQEEVWEAARAIADERYITLFGYHAFNQYHLQAATEALKEKRARAAASRQ